jgi:hypothetical protein
VGGVVGVVLPLDAGDDVVERVQFRVEMADLLLDYARGFVVDCRGDVP